MSPRSGLIQSLRSLRRAPVFTATVVFTLSLGIGASTAVFTVIDRVLLRPLDYPHPEQLVGAFHDLPPLSMVHVGQTTGLYVTYKKFARSLADIGLVQGSSASVTDPVGRVEPQRVATAIATASVFSTLQMPPLLGRTYTPAEDVPGGPAVVVISEGFWRARFGGDPSAIGKMLVVSGKSREIIGIMPDRFRYPEANTQLWLPMRLDPVNPANSGFNANAVARLRPGITAAAAERDLAATLPRIVEQFPDAMPGVPMNLFLEKTKPRPRLISLREDMVGGVAGTLWIVGAAAALLLLVTGANVANLLLVRADGRSRELSVRAALGAGRAQVLGQLFVESGILASFALVLGLGAAVAAVRILVHAGPANMPRLWDVHVDAMALFFAFGLALLLAVVTAVLPAIRVVRSDLLHGLRESGGARGGTVGRPRQRARSALVAAQMALALVALATAALLVRSFANLRAVRAGFDADQVATLWIALPGARYPGNADVTRFFTQIEERVAHIPGVTAAGITSRLPLENNGMNWNPALVEGQWDPSKPIGALYSYSAADSGYFRTLRIPLLAGRMFDTFDRQNGDEVIVSRDAAVRMFHDSTGRAALGKRFRSLPTGPWHTIIGVVGGSRDTSLMAPATAAIYLPPVSGSDTMMMSLPRTIAIAVRTSGDVDATTQSMRRIVRDMDATMPTFDVRPMREVVAASTARLTFTMIVLGAAAVVTLVLGVVGLYGVVAYVVLLRTRELGVRIALGATPARVAVMVTGQGLLLCAIGIAAGGALLAGGARLLRSFLFEVAPLDPIALGAAAAILAAGAMLAAWVPARRASHIDPAEALRRE